MAPRELTDDEVFGAGSGVAGKVWAAAERHGVDPAFALRVAQRESSLNPSARSPVGAMGVMQLMPATAAELGVNPNDVDQNIDGGVRYLSQQLKTFGDPSLAAAAYNAGPGRVRKAGGVPNIAETQAYVQAVAPQRELSDEEVFGSAAPPAEAAPQGRVVSQSGGVTVELGGPEGVQEGWTEYKPSPPSVLDDALSGFAQPFVDLKNSVGEIYQRKVAEAKAPLPSLGEAVTRSAQGLGDIPRLASGVLALTGAPVQAAVRPTARAIGKTGLTPYTQDTPFSAPRALQGDEAQAAIEGMLNTALQGARPAGVNLPAARAASVAQAPVAGKNLTQQVRAVTPQMPAPAIRQKAMSLEELKRADDAAWARVDASGYRFPKADVTATAKDVRQLVNEAGPELYPEASRVAARIESLAKRGDLTPAQANRLRSQVGEKLLQPGSTEASLGGAIKSRIDALIDTANNPDLAEARALHTRYKKVSDVTQRLEDAGINQASSGTGGNPNAARQALKPLVKNKSNQRMRNATPAEKKALDRVVKGTPTQNALRALSAFDPFHSRLGALLQGGLGIKTGGLSVATIPVGMAATAGERAIAQRNIQKLLEILSTGGPPMKAATKITPRGLVGGSVLAAPVARQEDRRR